MLNADISLLAGVRALAPLAHTDAITDPDDRILIIAVESETDHLPVGEERKSWLPEALHEKDIEIARCEQLWRERLIAACHRIASE